MSNPELTPAVSEENIQSQTQKTNPDKQENNTHTDEETQINNQSNNQNINNSLIVNSPINNFELQPELQPEIESDISEPDSVNLELDLNQLNHTQDIEFESNMKINLLSLRTKSKSTNTNPSSQYDELKTCTNNHNQNIKRTSTTLTDKLSDHRPEDDLEITDTYDCLTTQHHKHTVIDKYETHHSPFSLKRQDTFENASFHPNTPPINQQTLPRKQSSISSPTPGITTLEHISRVRTEHINDLTEYPPTINPSTNLVTITGTTYNTRAQKTEPDSTVVNISEIGHLPKLSNFVTKNERICLSPNLVKSSKRSSTFSEDPYPEDIHKQNTGQTNDGIYSEDPYPEDLGSPEYDDNEDLDFDYENFISEKLKHLNYYRLQETLTTTSTPEPHSKPAADPPTSPIDLNKLIKPLDKDQRAITTNPSTFENNTTTHDEKVLIHNSESFTFHTCNLDSNNNVVTVVNCDEQLDQSKNSLKRPRSAGNSELQTNFKGWFGGLFDKRFLGGALRLLSFWFMKITRNLGNTSIRPFLLI